VNALLDGQASRFLRSLEVDGRRQRMHQVVEGFVYVRRDLNNPLGFSLRRIGARRFYLLEQGKLVRFA
jgi:hypothetical protein